MNSDDIWREKACVHKRCFFLIGPEYAGDAFDIFLFALTLPIYGWDFCVRELNWNIDILTLLVRFFRIVRCVGLATGAGDQGPFFFWVRVKLLNNACLSGWSSRQCQTSTD